MRNISNAVQQKVFDNVLDDFVVNGIKPFIFRAENAGI